MRGLGEADLEPPGGRLRAAPGERAADQGGAAGRPTCATASGSPTCSGTGCCRRVSPDRPQRELRELTRVPRIAGAGAGGRGEPPAEDARGRQHQARRGGDQRPRRVGPRDARRADRRPDRCGRARRSGERAPAGQAPPVGARADRGSGRTSGSWSRPNSPTWTSSTTPSPASAPRSGPDSTPPGGDRTTGYDPGVGERTAEVLVAEIGTEMTRASTARHLASWAGMCPSNHAPRPANG